MFALLLFCLIHHVQSFCGDSIKWSHIFEMDDVYGMWYGIGYAQHTPDMTDQPIEVGCVTLFITDASMESQDWLDWSLKKPNYTVKNWLSGNSNPWSDVPMSGSWLDIKLNRMKRNAYTERRVKVIWDEDGQTMEQNYVYTTSSPGLWVAEQTRPIEREMRARGIELWNPDEPPRHPEVIRILNATQHSLIINHCSDHGDGGIFSLILRRSPTYITHWQWFDIKRKLYNFNLSNIFRYMAICKGCGLKGSVLLVAFVAAWLVS